MQKCETVGASTPFDHKKTQFSSFNQNVGDSTVNTQSEFDKSRFGAMNDQSPLKFDNVTG